MKHMTLIIVTLMLAGVTGGLTPPALAPSAFAPFVFAGELHETIPAAVLDTDEELVYQESSPQNTFRLKNGKKYEGRTLQNLQYTENLGDVFHRPYSNLWADYNSGYKASFIVNNVSFRAADISGSNFRNVFFAHADFSSAHLMGTTLSVDSHCRFNGAEIAKELRYGDYKQGKEGVRICGMTADQLRQTANWTKTLKYAHHKHMTRCVFIHCRFDEFNFTGFDLRGTRFTGHYGTGTERDKSYFAGIPAAPISRDGKTFCGSLQECNFTGTDLRHAVFEGQYLYGSNFTDAFLQHAALRSFVYGQNITELRSCNFTNARIEYAEIWGLSREQLKQTQSYKTGDLRGVKLIQCDLNGLDLSRCNLTGAKFVSLKEDPQKPSTDFAKVNFTDADITDCVFYCACEGSDMEWTTAAAKGLTAAQIKSTRNYKTGQMDGIVLPPEIQKELTGK